MKYFLLIIRQSFFYVHISYSFFWTFPKAEARYSSVLGMSILRTWDYSRPLPDLRLLVITPSLLDRTDLARLEQVGWGICYIRRLDYLVFRERKYRVQREINQVENTFIH